MIKLIITNMLCGHCRLQINAELESNGFKVIKIDINKNSVLIDAKRSDLYKIERILDSIDYVINDQIPILDITEYTIWDDKLDDELNYESFSSFLLSNEIEIIGFNDENFGMIILCTEIQFESASQYINQL